MVLSAVGLIEGCQPKTASGQKYAGGFDITTASVAIEAILWSLSCTQLVALL